MLDEQGEQLDNIETGLDGINDKMRKAEKEITAIEKCCGLFSFTSKSSKFKEDPELWQRNDEGKLVNNQPRRRMEMDEAGASAVSKNGGYITKITNDVREDEVDENI